MKITMYTTTWCHDCVRSKRFLDENKIDYQEINIEENHEAVEYVLKVNDGNQSVPTIVIDHDDGTQKIIVEPNNFELAHAVGLN